MILVTTTPSVDGYTITNYQGIVFGEVVSGVNMFKDLGAGLRNMFGGRSQGYEEELMRARNEAIAEMQQRAEAMGAHAVVGVDIDYEVLGADNGMLMVTASGTAVQIARTAVFCQVGVGRFGVSFSPCERRVSGRFGVGRSCWLLVIALVIA